MGLEFGAGVSVAENVALAPAITDAGPFTASVKPLAGVIAAAAVREGSATLVAVSTTALGDGKICGAVKTPLVLTVPHAVPKQPGPLSVHVTAVVGLPAEATLA